MLSEKSETPSFPFLFGGTFIEAPTGNAHGIHIEIFPFLFGGTFIEAINSSIYAERKPIFPSFSEGLSLRPGVGLSPHGYCDISLPFRRDFH